MSSYLVAAGVSDIAGQEDMCYVSSDNDGRDHGYTWIGHTADDRDYALITVDGTDYVMSCVST